MVFVLASIGCTDPVAKGDTAVVPGPIALPADCSTLPAGNGFRVGPEDANILRETLAFAPPGAVYLLDDGVYALTGGDAAHSLAIAPGVTVRSASGDASAVVLEAGYATTELVTLGEGALLAEVTVSHAAGNAVAIRGASGARVYGVVVVDPGDIGVAVLPERGAYSDDAVVACVTVTRAETCAVGIDGVQAKGAHVYGARIDAPGCDEPGIRFATGSNGTLVERSRVTTAGNAGIVLGGNDYGEGDERVYGDEAWCPERTLVGHYGGAVRNVFVVGGGVRVEDACGARVAHASIWGGDLAWSFSQDLVLANNLATVSDGGGGATSGNLAPTAADFADAAAADLHLAEGSAAIDAGTPVADVSDDIDGDERDGVPDVGADER